MLFRSKAENCGTFVFNVLDNAGIDPSFLQTGQYSVVSDTWGKDREEDIELDEETLEELSQLDEKSDFSKEKSQGLHGWFSRRGGKGKSKGWIDCNTCRKDKKTGKKTCKTCGRGEGEKRSKYPACRPTPSQCTRAGTKRKKSSKRVSWKSKKEE